MVMLYEGEDFANTDGATDRATAPPVGTAVAAAVHNSVDIPWLSSTSCMAIFPAASATASSAPFPCDAAAGEH